MVELQSNDRETDGVSAERTRDLLIPERGWRSERITYRSRAKICRWLAGPVNLRLCIIKKSRLEVNPPRASF